MITVEDPVEYRLGGIKQIRSTARRADLRDRAALDPPLRPRRRHGRRDLGRRDGRISIEAALTGHLVLSTHTNDAPAALTRLNEMGVEPFITGAAVSAVLAQRSRASSVRTWRGRLRAR